MTDKPVHILALESSGSFCSVALLRDADCFAEHVEAPRRHGELLLPMMERVLAKGGMRLTELDALAFGQGPGSFTGVRIAAAVAQGAAFGAGLPLVAVSTLAALARAGWERHQQKRILAVVDARLDEVYWGLFAVDGPRAVRALMPESVGPPERLPGEPHTQGAFGVGNGWALHCERLHAASGINQARTDPDIHCTAVDIAELAAETVLAGKATAPELGLPVYLRDRVASKPTAPSPI